MPNPLQNLAGVMGNLLKARPVYNIAFHVRSEISGRDAHTELRITAVNEALKPVSTDIALA